jgi:amino acid adenylation domain-containing protein
MSDALPLLPVQSRLWFAMALEGPGSAGPLTATARLTGAVDRPALDDAVRDVVRRHEALRAVFAADGTGAPTQRIGPADGTAGLRVRAGGHADVSRGSRLCCVLPTVGPDRHTLTIALHPLVGDRTSLRVVGRDLAEAYRGRRTGQRPQWTRAAGSYASLVREAAAEGEAHLSYWARRLGGLATPGRLPGEPLAGPATEPSSSFVLDPPEASRLRAFAGAHGAGLDDVLLTAMIGLVARLTGAGDVAVGADVDGRRRADGPLVGPFDATVVVRADVRDDPTLVALLARVRDGRAQADGRALPAGQIAEVLDPPPPRLPFLPMALSADRDLTGGDLDGLAAAAVTDHTGADAELTVSVVDGPDGSLTGTVTAAAGAVADAAARRLAHVLAALPARAAGPLSRLEVLPPRERAVILERFNDTDRPVADRTLPDLVERQVRRTPDDAAVVSDTVTLSYRELNDGANRLAHHLISAGVGPEDLVALALPRSAEATLATVAIAKAGAAYLPLDLDAPPDRLRYILADANPRLVLVRGDARRGVPVDEATIVDLAAPETIAAVAQRPAHDPTDADRRAPLLPENPAYVIYTSGSTGRPKGVVVTHRGIESVIFSVIRGLRIRPGSRVVQLASPSFDVAVWDTCCALFCGAALVVVENPRHTFGPWFVDLVARHGVTHVTLSPTALDLLADDDPRLAGLAVTVVGEDCAEHVSRRWSSGRQFVNGYGPTEVTICASLSEPLTPQDGKPGIGRPIDNVRVYVLDEAQAPAPAGVDGRLYVAGRGLGRGYVGRPDLTAERFLPNPFGEPGARMYDTGDLVRWRDNGELDFVGRADRQIKIRGYRVELGEIESVLAGCPGVAQVAVDVVGDELWNRRLVAYVVAADGAAPTAAALHRHAAPVLPDYMLPSVYLALPALPLTTSGKLDRNALAGAAAVPVDG